VELERIMYDYIMWMFGIDFCTPRCLISRELGMIKLKEWDLRRARRYEERISVGSA